MKLQLMKIVIERATRREQALQFPVFTFNATLSESLLWFHDKPTAKIAHVTKILYQCRKLIWSLMAFGSSVSFKTACAVYLSVN